jgi:glutaredoxin 3
MRPMNFTVYSKENCPYCYKIKQVLEMTGSNFETQTLGEDFTRQEFYVKFGQGSTFPQVVCDDKELGGCIDTIKFLREQQVIKS